MQELIEWYEDRFDPDEIPDILNLSMEDLIRGFADKASEYREECTHDSEGNS